MLMKLWQMLLLYLVLGIGPGDEGGGDDNGGSDAAGEEGGDSGEGADELPDDDLDSLIETVEGDGDKGGQDEGEGGSRRENDGIRSARKRAQEADEARIRAEAALDAERRIRAEQSHQPAPNEEQRLHEEEEKRLRDPEASELEKWQIRSNRTLRQNTRAANQALTSANEMRDKAEFDRLEFTKPKVYKLYKDKVEKSLSDLRAKGQDAPRMALLRFVIGNDVIEGNVKSSAKPRKQAADPARTGVDRGKTPGARSDVSARGAKSERDKRRERLRGVVI